MTATYLKLFAVLFLFIPLLSIVPAHAQEQIATIQCDSTHNKALIRFGLSKSYPRHNDIVTDGYYAPIPASLEGAWAPVSKQFAGQCKLKNGQTLLLAYNGVTTGRGDDFGDGTMNVSLTIDGHLAYDFFPIQNSMLGSAGSLDSFNINAILFDGTILQEYDETADGHLTYQDVSRRLRPDFAYTNSVEAAFWKKQQEQNLLSKHLSAFCKSFDFSNSYQERGKSWKLLSPSLNNKPKFQLDVFLNVREFSLDINNSGKLSSVFYIDYAADDNPENSVLVAFTKKPELAERFDTGIKSGTLVNNPEISIPQDLAAGSVQIGRQMSFDDYQSTTAFDTASVNVPFNYDGTTYIYSYTAGMLVEPASRILEMKPDNSVKEICRFP
jgi:hypothetical protein